MRKMNRRAYIAVPILLLVVTAAFVLYLPAQKPASHVGDTMTVDLGKVLRAGMDLSLTINVTRGNQTVYHHTYPHDILVDNFFNWLLGILNNAQSGGFVSGTLKDTGGTGRTEYFWGTISSNCNGGGILACTDVGMGGGIEVGTSSTAVTRGDFKLGTAYQSFFDTNAVCLASTTDSVLVTGSVNANTGATIAEAGLFFINPPAVGSGAFMFAHDTFTGVAVNAGDVITIQYQLFLNDAGFNYNLCELIAAYMTQPNGPSNTIKTPSALSIFYDTAGRNVTWIPLCKVSGSFTYVGPVWPVAGANPASSLCVAWASGQTINTMQINIGTTQTTFTPTTRSLTASILSNYITSTSYDSAGNDYVTTNILNTLGSSQTIKEAAIYMTLPNGCIGYSPNNGGGNGACVTGRTTDTIMLLAVSFAGQAVPNQQSIGITFQIAG